MLNLLHILIAFALLVNKYIALYVFYTCLCYTIDLKMHMCKLILYRTADSNDYFTIKNNKNACVYYSINI